MGSRSSPYKYPYTVSNLPISDVMPLKMLHVTRWSFADSDLNSAIKHETYKVIPGTLSYQRRSLQIYRYYKIKYFTCSKIVFCMFRVWMNRWPDLNQQLLCDMILTEMLVFCSSRMCELVVVVVVVIVVLRTILTIGAISKHFLLLWI